MSDDGPTFVKPTIGRIVVYFPDDQRRRDLSFAKRTARVWVAIITAVHDRAFGPEGEEIGPWVVSLTAFVPADELGGYEASLSPPVVPVARAPLAGSFDLEDMLAHPEWCGACWNWPPRGPL